MVFPEAVRVEGHVVVHGIVGGSYGGEDFVDWNIRELAVVQGDGRMAEDTLPRPSFSDSGTFSKPKWVVRASCLACSCDTRREQEKHL